MPAQLLRRLNRFLDQQVAADIMALEAVPRVDVLGAVPLQDPDKPGKPAPNTRAHWAGGSFGGVMANLQSIMIHETSGWPSYASANNFQSLFSSLNELAWRDPSGPAPGFWIHRRGIGPQYFVEPNGTAFTLIGPQNLAGDARRTWHGENMNPFTLGIENGDIGDSGIGPGAGMGPRWWPLSNRAEDLTGRKAYLLLHPRGAEDAVLVWIAQFPNYTDSGDIAHVAGWGNMLFTERNYRSLALLCRLLTEQFDIPRSFLLLPYLARSDNDNANLFRKLILADERGEAIALKLGTTRAVIEANAAAYTTWFNAGSATKWSRFFGANPAALAAADVPCFKGFISHAINGGHNCPGPLFDWHRFAREVWDWWWYPFDFEPLGAAASTTRRPYAQARRDTPLLEYFWDADGTPNQYNALREPISLTEKFRLPAFTPVYVMANGVVVAARFALSNSPAASGFLLVRHEVFHSGAAGRIDYDLAPTYVWTLTHFLDNAGFAIPAPPPALPGVTSAANPDWLQRFIIRLRECELAVQLHTAQAANVAFNRGWAHNPSGAGPRLATGQEIERDATAYRTLANDLSAGGAVLFPLEAQPAPTAVRVCLGDYLGVANRMADNQEGVQIEIFSNVQLNVPGAIRRAVSASTTDWWRSATAALRHEESVDADLPADGMVWQYRMTDFLQWVNATTWTSEWQKYAVTDAGGAPVAAPARPISRRVR